MLVKIFCDKFKSRGAIRKPIVFHAGLNTVLGDRNATNSIGKSTLLLVIDFVFGGDDYLNPKICKAVNNVGHHRICFTMEFNGTKYHFSRSTDNPKQVEKCDDSYQKLGVIKIDDYLIFLSDQYGIDSKFISFRDYVGAFFRIAGKATNDTSRPMHKFVEEKETQEIDNLVKVFGYFDSIKSLRDNQTEIKRKESYFSFGKKLGYIAPDITKREYENIDKKITEISNKIRELEQHDERAYSNLDPEKADIVANYKERLSNLRRKRTLLTARKLALESSDDYDVSKEKIPGLKELQGFFPNIDIRKIEEIEDFHRKLKSILFSQRNEEIEEKTELISLINQEIFSLERKLNELGVNSSPSKTILREYKELCDEKEAAENAKKKYDEQKQIKEDKKNLSLELQKKIDTINVMIQNSVNPIMSDYTNNIFQSQNKNSPILMISSDKEYILETPNDTGTGTQYLGLILFDLSIMKSTKLPLCVHDSYFPKNISDSTLLGILRLYLSLSKYSKQSFISFDRKESYSEEIEQIIDSTKVIELSDGNELFGFPWNKKKNETDL